MDKNMKVINSLVVVKIPIGAKYIVRGIELAIADDVKSKIYVSKLPGECEAIGELHDILDDCSMERYEDVLNSAKRQGLISTLLAMVGFKINSPHFSYLFLKIITH